jgi:hypothetical protein
VWWLVYQVGDDKVVWIEEATDVCMLFQAILGGQHGEFIEGHLLGSKARKVPKKYPRRALSIKEAEALLKRMG